MVTKDQTAIPTGSTPGLKRNLSLRHATLYDLGVTVGAGIYVLIGAAAAYSAMYAPAAFAIAMACTVLHVKDRYPAEGIVETAREKSCDLIVLASHGRRGISRMLLGSQATKVVTLSSVPVLVCR